VTSFFAPKLKTALKGRRFNDATMIKAKLQIMFAQFKTVDFTIRFECWCDYWAGLTKHSMGQL
jgi:hypothetical protein